MIEFFSPSLARSPSSLRFAGTLKRMSYIYIYIGANVHHVFDDMHHEAFRSIDGH